MHSVLTPSAQPCSCAQSVSPVNIEHTISKSSSEEAGFDLCLADNEVGAVSDEFGTADRFYRIAQRHPDARRPPPPSSSPSWRRSGTRLWERTTHTNHPGRLALPV
ncbi:hypothetical protein EYF80_049198 [Liparis tanakae]|uniref:Uncharacterized protein n=1 Tax=Liparis tanakae TaxID=230148 RepID=A0A4Z2FI69_9TELE|nr:hypothetical protein EYF80_049198 [Liparis tanakae]